MGREPDRASRRGATSATNRVTDADRRGRSRWRRHRARLGPARGLRRLSARARAGDALPHARQHERRLPDPQSAIRNRVVLTNKTPSGLVRGFGGPQVYFALERLMQRIAVTLGLDPLEVIRRNLVDRFPYRCPAGAVLDSGDYRAARRCARSTRRRARRVAAPPRRGAAPRAGSTASAMPLSSSRRSPIWATSPPC